ncbi:hypothetical protein chiPu_0024006, partial [Chiloscyllium punctatum]|nr:hypothetical protein [Chiloscyllium punctatum]
MDNHRRRLPRDASSLRPPASPSSESAQCRMHMRSEERIPCASEGGKVRE